MPTHKTETHTNDVADHAKAAAEDVAASAHATGQSAVDNGAAAAAEVLGAQEDSQKASVHLASEAVQRGADQLIKTFAVSSEESADLARQSSHNIQAVADCNTVLLRGMQDISKEWAGLAQANFQSAMGSIGAFSRCRSLQSLMAAHSDLMRDSLERMIAVSHRVSEVALRVTDDATSKIKTLDGGAATRRAA